MARVYYVDVAVPADRKKRRKHKTHAVFDGGRVFRVRRLTELDDASEIYIDAMFPQIYEELMELIRRSVKIFLLKSTRLLKRLREENGVEKSDEVDARLLSTIPRNHFKQLTLKDLKLLQLINMYERYTGWKSLIRRWASAYPDSPFKEYAKEICSMQDCYSRRIIKEIAKDEDYVVIYRMVCEELGVRDSVEVAILVARLPLNWKLRRLKGLLGPTPHKSKNYHHRLRRHLSNLATAIYIHNKRHGIGAKLFENMNHMSRDNIIYALQLRILKILKRAWQQRQHMLVGGQ
ncbi:MAG: hypothetical protein L2C94_001345 [Aigarchaeota archaeon]|nr:hypothetical protein [Candidatus Wolframiiraptor gerlachensis]